MSTRHAERVAQGCAAALGHELGAWQPCGLERASAECRCGLGVSVSAAEGERAMTGAAVTFRCPMEDHQRA